MTMIGVIEGFFGPQWENSARKSYAKFLRRYNSDFYIYAPKQDPHLRKKWREDWNEDYCEYLRDLVSTFHQEGIKFGLGFSPFGLGSVLSPDDKVHLRTKLQIMNNLGVDLLGLFFDDMPTDENLAKTQIEALLEVQKHFGKKIIFCPSYYTPDPILDKVFGQRPTDYLSEIASGVHKDVALAWTGPKVISSEISDDHLRETTDLLKRKPFIWENIFANDGPRNCKFLKIKPFSGRTTKSLNLVEGYGFNMMNQPHLSKILYLASLIALEESDPEESLKEAIRELSSTEFAKFLEESFIVFLNDGLDKISESDKERYLNQLKSFPDVYAREIEDWLLGKYLVGSECLTD